MIKKSYQHFKMCRDYRNVITVWLNHAERSMNVFDDEVLAELDLVISELEHDSSAKVVLFRSSKETGFLAGADVQKIADITPDEVDDVLLLGQSLFNRIAKLAIPTVAVIHGPCLGGGLEFALACRYRIALDNSSTRLGLPEVQLGVIPGWGGTQRMPIRVGLMHSLPLILKGKKLPASKALSIGLVDRIADDASWTKTIENFVTGLLDAHVHDSGSAKKKVLERFLDNTSIGRAIVLYQTKKRIARDVDNYPALSGAVRSIAAAFDKSVDGYEVERYEFSKLITTSTCRNLLDLFFRRERARNIDTWRHRDSDAATDLNIKKIGVVGAGAMGAGIGQLAALKGFDVVMKEVNDSLAEDGQKRIEGLLDDMVSSHRLPLSDRDACLTRVTSTSDWEPLTEVDFVVEAVVEREDVKRKVLIEVEDVVKPNSVITSNTSSLSVSRIAAASKRPHLIGGLHFFNPVHRMELVEVVRASETSVEVVSDLVRFVRALGKTPIVTADSPGFLVNRVLFPYVGEAIHMACEGVNVATIDSQVRKFGMPMGPLELLDHVGLDIAHHVAGSLESVLRDNEPVVKLLGKMVAKGWIGRKGGLGFYKYDGGRRAADHQFNELSDGHKLVVPHLEMADDGLTPTQRRLVYPLINESLRCLQERVVAEAWMVDLAMVLGTGFAPFRGGPLSTGEQIGWKTVLKNMQALQVMYGERFEPAKRLVELSMSNRSLFASNINRSGFGSKHTEPLLPTGKG